MIVPRTIGWFTTCTNAEIATGGTDDAVAVLKPIDSICSFPTSEQ